MMRCQSKIKEYKQETLAHVWDSEMGSGVQKGLVGYVEGDNNNGKTTRFK